MILKTLPKGIYAMALFSFMLVSCNKETKSKVVETETETATVTPLMPEAGTTTPAPVETTAAPAPPTQAAPAAAGTATAPGMNPPHGQPGHTCAIPVGAPLSSAPKAGTPAPAAQPQPQPAPQSFMQPQQQAQPQGQVAATAPGMNPPHGQPGHTCSVPVGSPLPKS